MGIKTSVSVFIVILLNPKGNLSATTAKPKTTDILVVLVCATSTILLLVLLWLPLIPFVVVPLTLLVLAVLRSTYSSRSDGSIYISRYMVHNDANPATWSRFQYNTNLLTTNTDYTVVLYFYLFMGVWYWINQNTKLRQVASLCHCTLKGVLLNPAY